MRSTPDDLGSASSSASPSSSTSPRSTGTAAPTPARSSAAPTPATESTSEASADDRGPIEIEPRSRAEAIDMIQRIHRRTGRPVVVKEGFPGPEAPEPGEASLELTGDTAEDTQRALESNEAAGGTKAPARREPGSEAR